jgi:hypothetical protein
MIIAVVVVESGCISEIYTRDNNDTVVGIDLDSLEESPDCPVCHEYLINMVCTTCGINWDDRDIEEIAMKILREEV